MKVKIADAVNIYELTVNSRTKYLYCRPDFDVVYHLSKSSKTYNVFIQKVGEEEVTRVKVAQHFFDTYERIFRKTLDWKLFGTILINFFYMNRGSFVSEKEISYPFNKSSEFHIGYEKTAVNYVFKTCWFKNIGPKIVKATTEPIIEP